MPFALHDLVKPNYKRKSDCVPKNKESIVKAESSAFTMLSLLYKTGMRNFYTRFSLFALFLFFEKAAEFVTDIV